MINYSLLLLALAPFATATQPVTPGTWEVTSKVVDLSVPGLPGFVARMVRGKSKSERKQLTEGQGIEALLAPDPKAQCRVDSQYVADGHYAQVLTCPQKQGEPMHIVRAGTYDVAGFVGRATVTGASAKGAVKIVLDQRAAAVGGHGR